MDKEAVFGILEPFPVIQVFLGGHITLLGTEPHGGKNNKCKNNGN
jgi:hypothetical protein